MSSISRNDPCSCGSGKKFKRCCGRFEVDAQARLQRMRTAAMAFQRWAARNHDESEVDSFQRDYLRALGLDPSEVDEALAEEYELLVYSLQFATLLCPLREDGDSLLERFLAAGAPDASATEEAFLRAWSETPLDAFVVREERPGALRLESLTGATRAGQPFLAALQEDRLGAAPDDLLLTRAIETEDGHTHVMGEFLLIERPFFEDWQEGLLRLREQVSAPTESETLVAALRAASRQPFAALEAPEAPEAGTDGAAQEGEIPLAEDGELCLYLPDWLDEGAISPMLPPWVRARVIRVGLLVAQATAAAPASGSRDLVRCLRRPDGQACGAALASRLDGTDVAWSCPGCGDGGALCGWEEQAFDLGGEARSSGEALVLGRGEFRRLTKLSSLEPDSLRILASARPAGAKVELRAEPEEAFGLLEDIDRALEFAGHPEAAANDLRRIRALAEAAWVDPTPPELQPARPQLIRTSPSARPEATGGLVLRVQLRDVLPTVWRRLELPAALTLAELGPILIAAMGWHDVFHWGFRRGSQSWVPAAFDPDPPASFADDVPVLDALRDDSPLLWTYDFGDDWTHELVLEQELDEAPRAPRCLAGASACPPEDSGGPSGYDHLLSVLRSPSTPEHGALMDWYEGPSVPFEPAGFDPTEFELDETNRRLAART